MITCAPILTLIHQARPGYNRPRGFSLAECLCSLAIVSLLTQLALPTLDSLAQRVRLDGVRDRWLNDLEMARSWSLRNAQESLLSRHTACAPMSDGKDWRCGWQVRAASSGEVLADTPLAGEVSVVFSASSELRVNSRGDPVTGGASLRIKPWRAESSALATTLCLNIAGRVHQQAGEGCST